MSSTDADLHTAQNLIHVLINPAPASSLVTLGYSHTENLRLLARIFNKASPKVRPQRVVPPEMEWQRQPIMENNPNTTQIPDHIEPTRVHIVDS